MKTYFTFPEQEKQWEAFASACGIVEFIRSYPDIFYEKDFEGLSLFAKQEFNRLLAEVEKGGEKLCSDFDAGYRSFAPNYTFSYQLLRTRILNSPSMLEDPFFLHIKQIPYEAAVAQIAPYLLAETPQEKSLGELFHNTTPSVTLETSCAVDGCEKKDLQMVVSMERVIQGKLVVIRILACQEHYEEVWTLCKDETFLVQYGRKRLRQQHFPEEEISKIIGAFSHQHARGKKTDPIIERFRIRQRLEDESALSYIESKIGREIRPFIHAYNDAFIDVARKYRMTPEAVALAQALPNLDYEDAITYIIQSDPCMWIEFEEPVQSPRGKIWGFSYAMDDIAHLEYAQRHAPLSVAKYERVKQIFFPIPDAKKWGLDAFSDDGDARWTASMVTQIDLTKTPVYWRVLQTLTMNWQGCASGKCGQNKPLCDACKKIDAWFYSFYVNCLRVLSGEFSEEENSDPDSTKEAFRTEKVKVHRKEPKKEQPWKIRDVYIYHTYSIVSFDVLKRKKPAEKKERVPRGSWMEKVSPESYIHVKRRIGKGEHKLVHPRYANYIAKHGDKLTIKAHYRWLPVQLKNMNKIYLAEAETPILLERDFPSSSC